MGKPPAHPPEIGAAPAAGMLASPSPVKTRMTCPTAPTKAVNHDEAADHLPAVAAGWTLARWIVPSLGIGPERLPAGRRGGGNQPPQRPARHWRHPERWADPTAPEAVRH